ncbi:XdhC family protein [Brevibacillus sp. H7]|uniref:XdhC family protein n=1 Tax=Brevibacillus sp. H7 TaxID=3349138 RepID=UPI00380AE9F7
MREQVDIVRAIELAQQTYRRGALATVVGVIGSAYRREGAKMFIDEEGNTAGMISGGCLEADVAEVASHVIHTGKPVRKRYVMDEELVWGLGLGCPGTVDIYIEPLPGRVLEGDVFHSWMSAIKEGRAGILCTMINQESDVYDTPPGRLFIPEEGQPIGHLGDHRWNRQAIEWSRDLFTAQHPKSMARAVHGSTQCVFLDAYVPPVELMIFGAGHDALPLARISQSLGFSATLVDPRQAYNTEDRFPGAKHVLLDPTCGLAEQLQIGRRTYVVIMNHHLERDKEALKLALCSRAPYVGMLGPRKRQDRIMNAILAEGILFTDDQLARLYNPIGLDIGADSPEEIALSIMAEILAVRNQHDGGFLRERGSIHQGLSKQPLLRSHSG